MNAWCLNGFYHPDELPPLYEAVARRRSCRKFLSAPSVAQWENVQKNCEKLCLPGVRLVAGTCSPSAFGGFVAKRIGFENVRAYVAVIAKKGDAQSLVNAGISGEMLMLSAIRQSLEGVWVAATYRKKELEIEVGEDEFVPAVIALGNPAEPTIPPIQRNRKRIEELVEGDTNTMSYLSRDIALNVRAAPSAMNRQPCRIRLEEPALTLYTKGSTLDLGIAMAHAVLAIGKTPATFTLSDDGRSIRIEPKA